MYLRLIAPQATSRIEELTQHCRQLDEAGRQAAVNYNIFALITTTNKFLLS
jgi:hypothetical protein